jgi:hypothetical protein
MAGLIFWVASYPISILALLSAALLTGYVVYQRFVHPLAKYPDPLLESLTDLWQFREFLSLKQPYNLTALHQRYGPIVRYGPDKLSLTLLSAIPVLYQKGGRQFPKTEFYDAYGSTQPNFFGMRDEAVCTRLFNSQKLPVCTPSLRVASATRHQTSPHVPQLLRCICEGA